MFTQRLRWNILKDVRDSLGKQKTLSIDPQFRLYVIHKNVLVYKYTLVYLRGNHCLVISVNDLLHSQTSNKYTRLSIV